MINPILDEGADRVRGRGEKRGREGETRGREEGEEGAGGGRRGEGGGRRGAGGGRGEEKREGGKFCAREARADPEGRRETMGREGGGKGAGGGTGLEIHACKLAKCELKFSFAS